MDSGFHAMYSGFQLLDSRSFSVELGFWIPTVIGIPDSYSSIPDSKAQKNSVGVCGTLSEILNLFQIEICYFPYPISDLTRDRSA